MNQYARRLVYMAFPTLLGAGCAPSARPASAPVASTAPATASQPAPSAPVSPPPKLEPQRAHRFLVTVAGCWFGGVWRDALNETESPDRCRTVLEGAYGTVDEVRLERLRAVEAVEVDDLGSRLAEMARADEVDAPRAEDLVSLLNAVAGAQHEGIAARRAADKIKKDIALTRDPDKRPQDEREAVGPLMTSQALEALLDWDRGTLGHDARAIALLCAMDRIELAKDLPKHVKVYAVGGPYALLYGVKAPDVPADATKPMKGGAWLAYLSEVAMVAGHPVPPKAVALQERELMAWGGAFEGLADKLRLEAGAISDGTELRHVVDATVARLDTEYRASEASILTKRP